MILQPTRMSVLVCLLLPSILLGKVGMAQEPRDGFGEHSQARVAERVRAQLGVERFALQGLNLPRDGVPSEFRTTIEHAGSTHVLRLRKHSVRSPRFRVLVQDSSGELDETPPPVERTYRGTLDGDPRSLVAASLGRGGLRATVLPRGGASWSVRPLSELDPEAAPEAHVVFFDSDVTQSLPLCGPSPSRDDVHELPEPGQDDEPVEPRGGGAADGSCTLSVADFAFDTDYELFERLGSDADAVTSLIEDGVNTINAIYERDVKITHRLSTIVIRSDPETDFYAQFPDASDFGAMLGAFRTEWNENLGAIERDMAYYVTGKSKPEYGGLAFVSTVCSNYAYGMGLGYSGFVAILRHEVGHNWGAGHSCGLERRYIMCGNSIDAISATNIAVMSNHRDSRDCLEEIVVSTDPEPPFPRPDFAIALIGQGGVPLRVLDGDTDANCDTLTISSYDERSAFGATIIPLDGLDERQADGFLYIPRTPLIGTDTFRYFVDDGQGNVVPSAVWIQVMPRGLVAHYPLDETSGTETVDATGQAPDGELRGDLDFATASVSGQFGGALRFPGADDAYVSMGDDPLFDLTAGLTVAAWFKVEAFDGDGETLVAKGTDAWRLKRDGTRSALKFTCSGVAGGEVAGSVPIDDGEWHHAAGVYDGATIALYIDGELDAASPASGYIAKNSSSLHLGDNAWSGPIDEVRIYNYGMSAEEVTKLFLGGPADNPSPVDAAVGANPNSVLTWVGSPVADGYDVYLGLDRTGVAAATPASAEYLGQRTSTSITPTTELGMTYFWRVDVLIDRAVVPGRVWSFSTSFAYTNFDEPSVGAGSYVPGPDARELGFRTTTTATGGQDPYAGVIETGSTPTTPIFSHRSVAAKTTFDPVDLSDVAGASVSLILQARDTGYEPEDSLEAYIESDGERVDLVSVEGGPGLSQFAGRGYRTFAATIPESWSDASLVLSTASDSSQGSERYDFDSVSFSCRASYRVIAFTHFEETPAGQGSHSPAGNDRELGFQTTSTPTGGDSSVAAVQQLGTSPGTRAVVHRSVNATTRFDAVALDGGRSVVAFATLRVRDTGYEAQDRLEVYVRDGAERIDLIRVNGDTGLNALVGNEYRTYGAPIPSTWEQATLYVETSSNSSAGSEQFDLRSVEFVDLGPASSCEPEVAEVTFRRGDANQDGKTDLSDGIALLGYLFLGSGLPPCLDAADTNDSGELDLTDGIRVFNYLFLGAEEPPSPGVDTCGPDPTADDLSCDEFSGCP